MADKTPNYGLTKPLPDEFYDVGIQNGNMDIIDKVLKDNKGILPEIQVQANVKAHITVTDYKHQLIDEASDVRYFTCLVPKFGLYTVKMVSPEGLEDEKEIYVDAVKRYNVNLDVFQAFANVNAPEGATVYLDRNNPPKTPKTAVVDSSGTVQFDVRESGLHTAMAEYEGCQSEEVKFNLSNGTSWTVTPKFVKALIVVDRGQGKTAEFHMAGIPAVSGDFYGANAVRKVLPKPGDYEVKVIGDDGRYRKITQHFDYGDCEVHVKLPLVLGKKVLQKTKSSPDQMLEKTYDLDPHTDHQWGSDPLFMAIRPCILRDGKVVKYLYPGNLAEDESGQSVDVNDENIGDFMLEIPKFYLGFEKGGLYEPSSDDFEIIVQYDTDEPCELTNVFTKYHARAFSLDAEGDCDKIYVGIFPGWRDSAGRLRSLPNRTPTTGLTLPQVREACQSNGTGYEPISFYVWMMLQALYLLRMDSTDSQRAVGRGCVGTAAPDTTGKTIASGPISGSFSDYATHVSFLNLEDLWGNCATLLDGFFYPAGERMRMEYIGSKFGDDSTSWSIQPMYDYTSMPYIGTGIVQYLSGDSGLGFELFPKYIGAGSTSTYYTDHGAIASKNQVLSVGGDYSSKTWEVGIFCLNNYPIETPSDKCCGRLVYKHKAASEEVV